MPNTTTSSKSIPVTNEYASLARLLEDGIVRVTGKDHVYRLAAKASQARAAKHPNRTLHITTIFDTRTSSYIVATSQKIAFDHMAGAVARYRAARIRLSDDQSASVALENSVSIDVETLTLGIFRKYHYELSKPVLKRRGLVDLGDA